MSLVVADRVKETTTGTGTGPLTLAGAVLGFRGFSDVCADGDEVFYCVASRAPGQWEVGRGRWTGGVLERLSVQASSSSGAPVSFSAGTKDVFLTITADAAGPVLAERAGFMPKLQYTGKRTVTAAQVKAAFSSPTTVIAAVADSLILPEEYFFHKPAGVAFGISGVTNHGLSWDDGTSINLFAPSGTLDQSAAKSLVMRGAGSAVSLWTGLGPLQFGRAVQYRCSGANPTDGDSDVSFWISYRVWPNAPLGA